MTGYRRPLVGHQRRYPLVAKVEAFEEALRLDYFNISLGPPGPEHEGGDGLLRVARLQGPDGSGQIFWRFWMERAYTNFFLCWAPGYYGAGRVETEALQGCWGRFEEHLALWAALPGIVQVVDAAYRLGGAI